MNDTKPALPEPDGYATEVGPDGAAYDEAFWYEETVHAYADQCTAAAQARIVERCIEFIRNNYQDHNIASLCDTMRAALASSHEIHSLQQQLAAEQANNAKLRDFIAHAQVSSGVCCCGDAMNWHASPMTCGHSPVDMWDYAVSSLLDTKSDDSALREWGARLLRKLAKDVPYIDSGDLFVKADELVSGDWKP